MVGPRTWVSLRMRGAKTSVHGRTRDDHHWHGRTGNDLSRRLAEGSGPPASCLAANHHDVCPRLLGGSQDFDGWVAVTPVRFDRGNGGQAGPGNVYCVHAVTVFLAGFGDRYDRHLCIRGCVFLEVIAGDRCRVDGVGGDEILHS